jgi:phosphatidylserine decarboxylase
MRNNLFIIAQSGWSYVGASLGAFVVFAFLELTFLSLLAFLLTLLFVFLFRNPEREFFHFEEKSIVSPVDGKVSEIVTLEDDSLYAYRVDIVTSYRDLSILRMPLNAAVQSIQIQRGARLSKESALFEALNENVTIVFETVDGATLKIEHRLTQSFTGLFLDIIQGQKLFQGMRYGMMQSGVTSLYFQADVRLDIQPMQELKASETLLGFLS